MSCNCLPGVVLTDSGASHVYVTADFAHRAKADISPCPHLSVHLADSDTKVPIEGMCKIRITLHRKHSVWVTAFVLPNLVHGVSLILGESWLKQHKVALDYGKMKCILRLPKGKLEISSLPPVIFNVKSSVAAALSSAHAPICVAKQAIRIINRGAKPFIMLIREQPARGAGLSEASLPRPGFPHLCASGCDVSAEHTQATTINGVHTLGENPTERQIADALSGSPLPGLTPILAKSSLLPGLIPWPKLQSLLKGYQDVLNPPPLDREIGHFNIGHTIPLIPGAATPMRRPLQAQPERCSQGFRG